VIAKIFKWLNMAIDLRCEDVVNRRDTIEYAKQDRNAALAAEAARTAKFEHAHNEAKTAFDEKVDAEMAKEAAEQQEEEGEEEKPKKARPEFDFVGFKSEFD